VQTFLTKSNFNLRSFDVAIFLASGWDSTNSTQNNLLSPTTRTLSIVIKKYQYGEHKSYSREVSYDRT